MEEQHSPGGSIVRVGTTTVFIGTCSCGWQSVSHRGSSKEAVKDAYAHKDWIDAKSKDKAPPSNPDLPQVS